MRAEQFVGDRQRPATPRARSDHQRDQLVVAERPGAMTQQLLSRSIVAREGSHRTTNPAAAIDAGSSGYTPSMSPSRLVFAVLVALTAIACATPPDKEIQQAQGAIDTAKAAGAEEYADEEFKAAQTALKNANDAVAARDYRLALNHALDARDRAQTAAKQTTDRKAAARVDADRAIAAAAVALVDARARLKRAEAAHAPAHTISTLRRAIASGDQAVQKARADLERGAYMPAADEAKAVSARLQSVAKDPESRTTAGTRRRH